MRISKFLVNPKYEALKPAIIHILSAFEVEGTVIHHKRNFIKVFDIDGLKVNVKQYHAPSLVNRYVYSYGIRKPKGMRAYEYPTILSGKGIETPEPIAYVEYRNRIGLLGVTYLLSVQCDYEHTLYEVKDMKRGAYETLAKNVAHFAAEMHLKNVMHKDFTPGNILWRYDENGYHFSIVDINRMYFGKVSPKQGLLNLKKLWGPKRFIEILVCEYARERKIDERWALSIVMPARAEFWRKYGKRHVLPFKLEI
jgi:hypothetical protein